MGNKISSKIRELRKANGFKSAESLAEALDVSLKTVQGWEKDSKEVNITLQNLLKMCELFKCDLDYLTGRIAEETHAIKTACEVTGLSEAAVKRLSKGKVSTKALSQLIESRGFVEFMTAYTSFLDLLEKMKHISPDYGLWTSYRQRADGSVVMNEDEAVHHYMNKASMALSYICEDIYNRKIKERNIRPNPCDYEDMLSQIEANEQEIKYLQDENEYLKKEYDKQSENPEA